MLGNGIHLVVIAPCKPYLPVAIEYRLQAYWSDSCLNNIHNGQPFHKYDCFANPERKDPVPLQLLDTAFKFHFDEIIQYADGHKLQPTSDFQQD